MSKRILPTVSKRSAAKGASLHNTTKPSPKKSKQHHHHHQKDETAKHQSATHGHAVTPIISETLLLKTSKPTLVVKDDMKRNTKNKKLQRVSLIQRQASFRNATKQFELLTGRDNVPSRLEVDEKKLDNLLKMIKPISYVQKKGQTWEERLSKQPPSRNEILGMDETIDAALQRTGAKNTELCSIKQAVFAQAFDEMIRQVSTVNVSMGYLLLRVRNEYRMMIKYMSHLYFSQVAYGMRKVLKAQHDQENMKREIDYLTKQKVVKEDMINDLEKRYKGLQKAITAMDKNADIAKLNDDITALEKANAKLTVQLKSTLQANLDDTILKLKEMMNRPRVGPEQPRRPTVTYN